MAEKKSGAKQGKGGAKEAKVVAKADKSTEIGGKSAPKGGKSVASDGESVAKGGKSVASEGKSVAKGGKSVAKGGESVAKGGESVAKGGKSGAKSLEIALADTKTTKGTKKSGDNVTTAIIEVSKAVVSGAKAVAKGVKAGAKAAATSLVMPAAGDVVVPAFDPVELNPPSRTWKGTYGAAELDAVEERLRLGWFFREELDPLLPDGEDFHPRAWTALGLLRAAIPAQVDDPQRAARIAKLVAAVTPIRRIVVQTTSADDPAREAVRTSEGLNPTGLSIEIAGEIIANAKKLAKRFPALRGGVIPAAESALTEARDADAQWKTRKAQRAAAGALNNPTLQVANDTLRDCVDYLEAAAIGAFLGTRASMAEPFTGALGTAGGGRKKKKAGDEKPAPAPAK